MGSHRGWPRLGSHRVARSTGWLGVLLTIGLGIFLLIEGVGLALSLNSLG
jgi:hypothetical protein